MDEPLQYGPRHGGIEEVWSVRSTHWRQRARHLHGSRRFVGGSTRQAPSQRCQGGTVPFEALRANMKRHHSITVGGYDFGA
jgi:hypothetical protein